MFCNPFLYKIKDSKNILIAGCGGGYDFMNGIPLYEHLSSQQDKNIIMGNYTFSGVSRTSEKTTPRTTKNCFEVSKDSMFEREGGMGDYFPEKYCCEYYFDTFKKDLKVYTFSVSNVKELEECYEKVVEKHSIDTIILVDGGNDSLMRGDEESLGTVVEDMSSISAVYRVRNVSPDRKFLVCLGFGIDHFHGVNFTHVLENMSNIIKTTDGGYLGCFSIVKESREYQVYKDAFDYVNKKNKMVSIVGSSIISATDGEFGDFHSTFRTEGSKLFINPLMSVYWCFDNQKVAEQIHFIKKIIDKDNKEIWNVREELRKFKKDAKIRNIKNFPH